MIYHPDIWFPPANILYHGNLLLAKGGKSREDIRHIHEAMSVAAMLTGIIMITDLDFYIQVVDPREQTPDIKTMTLARKPGELTKMQEQFVEVVTLEEHSDEQPDVFIKRTKLNPLKKSYPLDTIILCHINKTGRQLMSMKQIHESLSECVPKNDVYIVGRVSPDKQIYKLAKVHPKLEEYPEYDAVKVLSSRPVKGVLKLHRGTNDEFVRISEKTLPFE